VFQFDAYLMVDWSASSKPKSGEDSIWLSLLKRGADPLKPCNPRTRQAAYERVRNVLLGTKAEGLRTLVGFDFPYGYPAGFARLAGLKTDRPWKTVWDELHRSITDDESNRSNRVQVAAEL
jgi:hypothetical protein